MLNRLSDLLNQRDVVLLDGGLATELERRGHDLSDSLWSARLLRDAPDAVRQVHRDWLEAGADCVTTASYQATVPGFTKAGLSEGEATRLLRLSVRIAREARDEFVAAGQPGTEPAIAASIGPYGAYLADGSEYRGRYGLSKSDLQAFHEPRWQCLLSAGPDVMACETIPDAVEAAALLGIAGDYPHVPAWFSFCCRDGTRLWDGTPIRECAAMVAEVPSAAAVGVNCTSPEFVSELIGEMNTTAKELPIVVYPNSGETWDASARCWRGDSSIEDYADLALEWKAAGARVIGGCCRTTVDHIAAVRQALR